MAEDKITAAETANEGKKKSENIVELARPYGFEGKEYGEIDLTGLEKLTVQDAIDVQRQLLVRARRRPRCCARPRQRLPAPWRSRPPECPLSFSS